MKSYLMLLIGILAVIMVSCVPIATITPTTTFAPTSTGTPVLITSTPALANTSTPTPTTIAVTTTPSIPYKVLDLFKKPSEHYKQYHDYQSLVLLIPGLEFGMTRFDVEQLLGEPVYCPTGNQCYYSSDESTHAICLHNNNPDKCFDSSGTEVPTRGDFTITLVVGYQGSKNKPGSPGEADTLQSFDLGPVGE